MSKEMKNATVNVNFKACVFRDADRGLCDCDDDGDKADKGGTI
jgi:hypothetical protein